MRPIAMALLALVVVSLAACGSDDDPAVAPTTVEPSTTTTGTGAASPGLTDQFGVRYCEVLTVTVGDEATQAEVWGTQGLNDCPQEPFETIDAEAVATELGVTVAVPNGPRYWVLDRITANQLAGSGETHTFGGIEMRSIAAVDLGSGTPDRSAYAEISVERDTEFIFDAEREIYELTTPEGSVYVMQSYSIEVDPTLTIDDLAGLGDRLELPEGWTFTSRVLEDELVVEDLDGVATVVQDDLHNTYQLRTRG